MPTSVVIFPSEKKLIPAVARVIMRSCMNEGDTKVRKMNPHFHTDGGRFAEVEVPIARQGGPPSSRGKRPLYTRGEHTDKLTS